MPTRHDENSGILVIRLGAMGDIIHALPAAASLKASFPQHRLSWLVSPRWMPLLEGNPAIDELIGFERSGWAALKTSWRRLRQRRFDLAFDFQGLLQSALAGRAACPKVFYGFSGSVAREAHAAWFYDHSADVTGPHRVERNLQLIASANATRLTMQAWIPQGKPEGHLPTGPFVLANPFAGWAGKEWPLPYYELLGQRLRKEGLKLVVSVPAQKAPALQNFKHTDVYISTLSGLIDATRRATAIVGVDSGPLHLAAALGKPGVAIFGPTDPAYTGPFGGSLTVLRAPNVETTYKRHREIHASMKEISVEQVTATLLSSIENGNVSRDAHRTEPISKP
jgi:heptosyltransferase-1